MACFCTGACKVNGGRCGARDESWLEPFRSIGTPEDEPSLLDLAIKQMREAMERTNSGRDEAPGFHPVDDIKPCLNPGHGFPTHLYIPSGMKYVHYCPGCGMKTVAFGSTVTL